jgi:fructokinase
VNFEAVVGGVEAGGTKFLCAIGSRPGDLEQQVRIDTTTPQETLGKVVEFFRPHVEAGTIRTIGVGCFGPLDLDPHSTTFGHITSTPKEGWRNISLSETIRRELRVRVALDTDVNAAALGEAVWGAGRDRDPLLYLTVGTGIGGGLIQAGKPMRGMSHSEMGHIRVPHNLQLDPFPGNCPFHRDCFEGLANGPAIEKRLGSRGESLADDDPFWHLEAGYIAAALATYILVVSPSRIILGGGIMQRGFLFPLIRANVQRALNSYVQVDSLLEHVEAYIVPPQLGTQSGIVGALVLAQQSQPFA